MESHIAYICVGSNIGDKIKNCKAGIETLTRNGKSRLKAQSEFYQTEPMDYKDQDWFVNVAAKIETSLDPFALLKALKRIERNAGRTTDTIRFGPRILDMDIILYDDLILETPGLVIPHPRMHKRRFVLTPLCDIGSDIVHPVLMKNMKSLHDNLNDTEQGVFPIHASAHFYGIDLSLLQGVKDSLFSR